MNKVKELLVKKRNRIWKKEEDFLRETFRRIPIKEIATKLERTQSAIIHRVKLLGLGKNINNN